MWGRSVGRQYRGRCVRWLLSVEGRLDVGAISRSAVPGEMCQVVTQCGGAAGCGGDPVGRQYRGRCVRWLLSVEGRLDVGAISRSAVPGEMCQVVTQCGGAAGCRGDQ